MGYSWGSIPTSDKGCIEDKPGYRKVVRKLEGIPWLQSWENTFNEQKKTEI